MEAELKSVLGDAPKIAQVASGFTSASGPVYSRRGYLLFCDTGAGKILKRQDGAVTPYGYAGQGARACTFDHQGRLLACEKGRVTRVEKGGAVTVLAGSLQEPLDVVFAIDGNVYFCDAGAIYQVKRTGGSVVASRDCQRPAGLALSPNQQMLYASDAAAKNVRSFRMNADGSLAKGSVFAQVSGAPGHLKTDETGRVWVLSATGISVFSHDGKALGSVPISDGTGMNWGEGFRNIYVTSKTSLHRIDARLNGTRTY